MVKVKDLGYASKNLQDMPSKEDRKKSKLEEAIMNLAGGSGKGPSPNALLELLASKRK